MAFKQHEYACKICGENFEAAPPKWFEDKNLTPPTRCPKCKSLNRKIEHQYTCHICKSTFDAAPPSWFMEKGLDQPTRCADCKNKKSENHTYTCSTCRKNFDAAPPEWFKDKKLSLPIRCKECKSSGKRLGHAYICTICNKTFDAAPPEWFKERGLAPPNKCNSCRINIKLISKEHTYLCQSCGGKIISAPPEWFLEKGLSLPRFCKDCKTNGKTKLILRFADSFPSPIEVPADRKFYESIPLRQDQKEKYNDDYGGSQLDHIMSEGHKWEGWSPERVLERAREIALSDDSDSVLQFDQGDGKIVKYYQPERWLVIITEDTYSPTGYRILTTYVLNKGDIGVFEKLRDKEWTL